MYDHQLALVLSRVRPRDPNTVLRWVSETGFDPDAKQAENVTAMHRVHRASLPRPLKAGCFAVWSEYGTIPTNDLITWRLEKFRVVADAKDAFTDRMHQAPGFSLPHYFAELGVTEMPASVTPLSRMWIYRVDPRDTDVMPDYGFEIGPKGGVATVKPDPVDDEMRHLVRAEDLCRRALGAEVISR